MLESINDENSFKEVSIERNLQMKIGGGCNVPLGINAAINKESLILNVVFGRENGEILIKDRQEGDIKDAGQIIDNAAVKLSLFRSQ